MCQCAMCSESEQKAKVSFKAIVDDGTELLLKDTLRRDGSLGSHRKIKDIVKVLLTHGSVRSLQTAVDANGCDWCQGWECRASVQHHMTPFVCEADVIEGLITDNIAHSVKSPI